MIVVLLAALVATVATGWLLTTDAFWGSTGAQRESDVAPTPETLEHYCAQVRAALSRRVGFAVPLLAR